MSDRVRGATDEHHVWLYVELKKFIEAELDRSRDRVKDGSSGYHDGKILALEGVLSFARGMEQALAERTEGGES